MPAGTVPRVIIVDDDAVMTSYLGQLLRHAGIDVKTVTESAQALPEVESYRPDMAILDVVMPGMNGYDVCRSIRQELGSRNIPVLFLSSLGGRDDILKGLEVGADDYLTKPVDPEVFVAKIQARLRALRRRPPVTIGTMEISAERQEIRVGGRLVELTPAERNIVFTLSARKGEAVSRRELLQGIHGTRTAVSSRTVDVWMTALRRKLESEGERIETVRGYGYRLRVE